MVILIVKDLGVKDVICWVENCNYVWVLQWVGVDLVVCFEYDLVKCLIFVKFNLFLIDYVYISDDIMIVEVIVVNFCFFNKIFSELDFWNCY